MVKKYSALLGISRIAPEKRCLQHGFYPLSLVHEKSRKGEPVRLLA